jgi:hypothetical protein
LKTVDERSTELAREGRQPSDLLAEVSVRVPLLLAIRAKLAFALRAAGWHGLVPQASLAEVRVTTRGRVTRPWNCSLANDSMSSSSPVRSGSFIICVPE